MSSLRRFPVNYCQERENKTQIMMCLLVNYVSLFSAQRSQYVISRIFSLPLVLTMSDQKQVSGRLGAMLVDL